MAGAVGDFRMQSLTKSFQTRGLALPGVARGSAGLRLFATDGSSDGAVSSTGGAARGAARGGGARRARGREPGGEPGREPGGKDPKRFQKRPAYSAKYRDRHGTEQARGDDSGARGDRKMRTVQRVAPMSLGLRALYEAVAKGDAKALAKYKEMERKDRLTDEEMELLADTIEFYFSMAPSVATSVDGLRAGDRHGLKALYKIIRTHSGSKGRDAAIPDGMPVSSPVEKTVVNTAPPGRVPWQVLGVNEDTATVWWGVDLTGGKAKDPWSNGRLSQAAKNAMYEAYASDPARYTPARLAEIFGVREQRAMAIVRLMELERKEGREELAENQSGDGSRETSVASQVAQVMERALQCTQGIGSDERHHTELPSFPAYAELDKDEVISALEKVLGKNISDVSVEDISADVAKRVLGTNSIREMESVVAVREERHLVEEFKERLDYNLGITGQTIARDSRRTKAIRRPKEGWSLLVTPIGKESKAKHERFVALPDGSVRDLTADEQLYVARKTPKQRRRIL